PIGLCQFAAARDDVVETLELLAPDGRLYVGHPVVVAAFRIGFEHHLAAAMALEIRHRHAMLPPQPEPGVDGGAARGQHAALSGGDDLARMEREADDVAMRASDPRPGAVDENLRSDRAGRVLDYRHAMDLRNGKDGG